MLQQVFVLLGFTATPESNDGELKNPHRRLHRAEAPGRRVPTSQACDIFWKPGVGGLAAGGRWLDGAGWRASRLVALTAEATAIKHLRRNTSLTSGAQAGSHDSMDLATGSRDV